MVKTAALVVVAIILGVIMLNIIDDGSTSKAVSNGSHSTTTVAATTSTTTPHATTTTTVKIGPVVPPGQLRIIVLNAGSGVNGAASTMSHALKNKGYLNQATPTDTSARAGTQVACRSRLAREARSLQIVVDQHSVIVPFPPSPPTGVDSSVQCIVFVGKPASTTATT
jgi:hypothetical protein